MQTILIILPVNLYKNFDEISMTISKIFIVEHPVYFTDYKYHKQKLILHRASMKYYNYYLKEKGYKVTYVNYYDYPSLFDKFPIYSKILFYDPVDHKVQKNLIKQCNKHKFYYEILDTKTFITPLDVLKKYNDEHEKLIQYHFYQFQRKRLNIMLNKDGSPFGGKWSFDIENRLKFDDNYKDREPQNEIINKFIIEAKQYIEGNFKNNPGANFNYMCIDHKSANLLLIKFINNKLEKFGPYQDAESSEVFSGYHSVLSPLINIGLVDPKIILKKVIKNINVKNHKLLISIEAYVRQLLGWREYCRLIYMFRYNELDGNYFNNEIRLSKTWYEYNNIYTGFYFIDNLIKKVWNFSYLHHIERLMYIGNYLLLLGVLPHEVYQWFQIMFLDSYAVFMYPNVYGMSQYACGPVMMTKPYFSSASYISKMSNYNLNNVISIKGMNNYKCNEVWNSLYYAFISKHSNKLKKNYGTASQVMHWNNKTRSEKSKLLKLSRTYKKIIQNY